MTRNGLEWPRMAKNGQEWPGIASNDRESPGIVRNSREWPGMAMPPQRSVVVRDYERFAIFLEALVLSTGIIPTYAFPIGNFSYSWTRCIQTVFPTYVTIIIVSFTIGPANRRIFFGTFSTRFGSNFFGSFTSTSSVMKFFD